MGASGQRLRGLWFGMIIAVVLHVLSFGFVVWRVKWDQAVHDVKQRQASSAEGIGQSELSLGTCTHTSTSASDTSTSASDGNATGTSLTSVRTSDEWNS